MATPTISMGDEFLKFAEDRRHASVSRSQHFREALLVRYLLEDEDVWEDTLQRAQRQWPAYRANTARNEADA
ncbi:hypothetical protein [Haloprofundus salilacus]|uniref:hypothetical protein n=1 Tax=Haloprofundus salilacus TaxID=2876190 RepID=UPI001CCA222E|nr:hypothetical protein [Haloprofundus salilacus]